MKKLYGQFVDKVSRWSDCSALLTRLVVGFVFAQSGWGKLHHLDKVAEFFTSLGIPAAHIQAPFVALVELIGGLCLIFGFVTRLAAIPLIGTMIVAIVTAKRGDINEFSDLLGMSEFLYIVLFVALITYGPGKYSIDQRVFKKK
jgi:putative oxidoreductase